MEDFGYKSESDENYSKALIKKALLISLILFSVFCFVYIAVNAYNYFQSNKKIKTIKAEVVNIKTYPDENKKEDEGSKVKIDSSIYEDIFGTRKAKKEKVKIKKVVAPAMPPIQIEEKAKTARVVKKAEVKKIAQPSRRTQSGRKMSRVQLAAMTTKDGAITFLKVTKSRHSNIFSGLDGYIQEVDLGKRGIFFRVQVGDFYDQIRAENFCKKYIAAAQKSRSDCIIVE